MVANPLFIIPSLTGLIFIIVGTIFLKYPPKKINGFYGYRTPNSMKSQEKWDFSQKLAARMMIKQGFIMAAIGLIGLFYSPGEKTGTIVGLGILIVSSIILIYWVESAIKKKFK